MPFYIKRRHRKLLKVGLVTLTLLFLTACFHGRKVSVPRSEVWKPMAGFRRGGRPTSFLQYDIRPRDESVIPRIIHQTWKSRDIPALMQPWVDTWLPWKRGQSDWEYWFWTDEDILAFIRTKYPDYLELFQSYPDNAYRVDAFRYFVLYEYGGLYVDLDTERLRSLNDVISSHACILTQEPQEHAHFLSPLGAPLISNAVMACRPGHDFFETVIGHLRSYSGWLSWNGILHATGPYMLTEVYRGHISRAEMVDLHLAEPSDFQPTIDNSMLDRIREVCLLSAGKTFFSDSYLREQQEICTRVTSMGFRNSPAEKSYTDHHWTHTWAGPKHDPWGILNSDRTFRLE